MSIGERISGKTLNILTFALQGFQKKKIEKGTENSLEEIIAENSLT